MDSDLRQWIGREEVTEDVIDPQSARLMRSILDPRASLAMGERLPPLWHWLYMRPSEPLEALGSDGHPRKGGFLPPIPLPRRMWAGGRIEFLGDLLIGDRVRRRSRILDISEKRGSSGTLCFVTVEHLHEVDGEARLREEQDIVYRERPAPGESGQPRITPRPRPDLSVVVKPDPVMLFRYSAVTFNGHRIHYDREYATRTEGYPGLVVQGPLTATLLANLAARAADTPLASFRFRGEAPLFDLAAFTIHAHVNGTDVEAWAEAPEGHAAMSAQAEARR
ncbi:MAG: MaoC family dehydratase N-terminal domain-containing protein [Rhodospirillum sp.]|nr:MaoC family dehydratase N-terminal domain-containing protein [Rhodospirillum sp.]MCF8490582.1 MaoC family dehydratase N-terminal domain-containing protein [Rhodospirillum sp.]MCF8502718.1 MaoC family dehydratase N-terminal domain-containing protein [Rhodospirillum sp.]